MNVNDIYIPKEPAHSPWGASSAKRYMECPRSVAFQRQFPNTSSDFADRGTIAHNLGEMSIKANVDPFIMADLYPEEFEALERQDILAAKTYFDFVTSVINNKPFSEEWEHWGLESEVELEIFNKAAIREPRYHDINPAFVDMRIYGKLDFYAYNSEVLHVADYKHGEGVYVDEEANEQMSCYALFKWDMLGRPPVKHIYLTIIQPRAIGSYIAVRTWECDTAYLSAFELKLAAAVALSLIDDAPGKPGDWCQFCRAAGSCPILGQPAFDLIENDEPAIEAFGAQERLDPLTLSDEKVVDMLLVKPLINKFLLAVEREALRRATLGRLQDDRVKMVAVGARKAYKSHASIKAVTDSAAAYGVSPKDLVNHSLLTPAQVVQVIKEQVLDKELQKQAIMEFEIRFVEKDSSGFKVAPASDKGKAITFNNPTEGLQGLLPPPKS